MSRRAPGNADMRAALAALYWSQGKEGAAESEWEFACNNISGEAGGAPVPCSALVLGLLLLLLCQPERASREAINMSSCEHRLLTNFCWPGSLPCCPAVGCAAYRDEDWLFRIRRWPPVMVQKMHNFLSLRSAS